jgi:hypothetical protein
MLKYKKTVGDVDLYGSYLFEDSEYLPGDGLRYKRKGGGSIGVGSQEVLIPTAAEGEGPVIRSPAQRGTDNILVVGFAIGA